jgi:MoaA/NifB/PqqE/SkfB family radical SAM enzyme
MVTAAPNPSLTPRELLAAWGRILTGRVPLLSIEITRECPLSCPGCYAYGDTHLGGEVTLRQLNDLRGDALVHGVLQLVRKHKPMHVSLVGGEPMVRHRELTRILPALRVAVSVDGLPEHHDIRRKPATYERILKNIEGREVNIHWTITRPMLARPGYLEEYVAFWSARPEVNRIWVSVYTPQVGEQAPEMLTREDRVLLAQRLPSLRRRYPKLLTSSGIADAIVSPPANPEECLFSKMSVNYSADFKSRVEPCVFGGTPDCSQCGCAISSGLHWIKSIKLAGPLKIDHFVRSSIGVGRLANRLRQHSTHLPRWRPGGPKPLDDLVQIQP